MSWNIGDVVQIDPVVDGFGGCLMVVTEPKSWGAQGYVSVPGNDRGRAYFRLKKENGFYIGKAEWIEESIAEDVNNGRS